MDSPPPPPPPESATSNRETRRRRIIERGSDRFALITGRVQALPPESAPSVSAIGPPSISPQPSDLVSATDTYQSEDKLSAPWSNEQTSREISHKPTGSMPFLRRCEALTSESSEFPALDLHQKESPEAPALEIHPKEAITESSEVPAQELHQKDRSLPSSSTLQTPGPPPASEAKPRGQRNLNHLMFCSPSQISSAIAKSEMMRNYCALAAAVLVLLSYIGFPILSSRIVKSVIFLRPLYLLIITDISIVAAKLLEQKQRGPRGAEVVREQTTTVVPPNVEYGFANQLGDALEIGYVLQKILGALFMDCSIYSVAVICGLSFAERFFF